MVLDGTRGLRDVAEDRHRTGAPAREHSELHRRQVLRFVDDHVPVRLRRPVEQGARLVDERQVRLAPAAAAELLLREDATHELLGLDARPRAVDELSEERADRTLELVERPEREVVELAPVLLVQPPRREHAEPVAPFGVRSAACPRLVDQRRDVVRLEVQERAVHANADELVRRNRQSVYRFREPLRDRDVGLAARKLRLLAPRRRDPSELVDRPLLDALLAECRQHVRDVVHEHGVRPDHENAGALELAPVRVKEPRRSMQADRGLARPRPALHDEDALRLTRDQRELVRLDRRDDVAHVLVAAALELLEQDVRNAVDDVARRSVERLVVELEQPPPVDAKAPS